jgi:hypothetical protein
MIGHNYCSLLKITNLDQSIVELETVSTVPAASLESSLAYPPTEICLQVRRLIALQFKRQRILAVHSVRLKAQQHQLQRISGEAICQGAELF